MTDTRKVTAIINGVRAERGGSAYFNDKLKSGARSIKVWGRSDSIYGIAAARLEKAGFAVKYVRTPGISFGGAFYSHPQTRLHVSEKLDA